MGIQNASRVMRILGKIKPKNRDEQDFHDHTVVGILEEGLHNYKRLGYVLPELSGITGSSICTDVYCTQMLEALLVAQYAQAHKILDDIEGHVLEIVKGRDDSWIVFPAAIVGVLNVSTWARLNSGTVDLNTDYEEEMYWVVGKLMAHYFRNVPDDAPAPSTQIVGQFNDALVQHTSEPVVAREAITAMLKPFRGHENKFQRKAYEMASKFTHRAMSVLAFSLQMDALIEAYEFTDRTPEHRSSVHAQVM